MTCDSGDSPVNNVCCPQGLKLYSNNCVNPSSIPVSGSFGTTSNTNFGNADASNSFGFNAPNSYQSNSYYNPVYTPSNFGGFGSTGGFQGGTTSTNSNSQTIAPRCVAYHPTMGFCMQCNEDYTVNPADDTQCI